MTIDDRLRGAYQRQLHQVEDRVASTRPGPEFHQTGPSLGPRLALAGAFAVIVAVGAITAVRLVGEPAVPLDAGDGGSESSIVDQTPSSTAPPIEDQTASEADAEQASQAEPTTTTSAAPSAETVESTPPSEGQTAETTVVAPEGSQTGTTPSGGVANEVWRVKVDGRRAVGRLGSRSDADLAWETELLRYLDQRGLAVPVPIPTTDGKLFADGLVVMTYVEGEPPDSAADWQRVAETLGRLHRLTRDWPQRPGWRSSTDLLEAETGTKVDLRSMPPDGVARCRAAWARLVGRDTCVVHGDPNPGNIRITEDRVALIDWDEAHVDAEDLDLVLPHNAADLDDERLDVATQASAAWEAAVCWDDDYAIGRLAEVRTVT